MKDLRKMSRMAGFKQQSAGPWELSQSDQIKYKDSEYPACHKYDTQPDKFGFCRNNECRGDRLIGALMRGEARRLSNGTLIWYQDGIKIVDHNKKK